MTDRNKVVWSEGQYLRTQHLQQQDRHFDWLLRQALRALSQIADGIDEELATKLGGRTTFPTP